MKKCVVCGVIFKPYDDKEICDCCRDELDECNPYNNWMRGYDIEEDADE